MNYLSDRYVSVYKHKDTDICTLKKTVPANGDEMGYVIDSEDFKGQVFNDVADAIEAIDKRNAVREYALVLLKECNCSLDCYRGDYDNALKDMRDYSCQNDVPYPLEDIAKALVEIGNEQPIPPRQGHKPYCVIFDTEDTTDGSECDTYEEAEARMLDILTSWIVEEQTGWKVDEKGIPQLTEEQTEQWNMMIDNCCAYIAVWNEETNEYDDMEGATFPTTEMEHEIGWLYWDELRNKNGW